MVGAVPSAFFGPFLSLLLSRRSAGLEGLYFFLLLLLEPFLELELRCLFRLFFYSPSLLPGSTLLFGASS